MSRSEASVQADLEADEELQAKRVRNAEFADGLRRMADWFEAHPRIAPPFITGYIHASTHEEAREVVKAMPKPVRKNFLGDSLYAESKLAYYVSLTLVVDRAEVCEAKVVGTREVPEKVTPARTENIIEWTCTDSLLAPDPTNGG